MAINWQMGLMPDIGGNALAAFEAGRQRRQQAEAQAAMGAYATNPNAETLNALAPINPQFVMQERRAQQQTAAQQQERQLAQMPMVAKLLDSVQDEGTFQQAKQLAARFGIPLDGAPDAYDPQWVDSNRRVARMFVEQPQVLSTIAKELVDMGLDPNTPQFAAAMAQRIQAADTKHYATQAGGGLVAVAPGQTPQFVIQPNDGSQPVGAPVQAAGGPRPGTIEDGYRFKGGNPADPSAWEPVGQGGGAPSRVTAGFLP